ncbi:hypothetical protein AMECASPLE_018106 [Ameca splendens]|uniref:Uncharacterized protein n=1 Tax=Ameca splendens TaxID=208324 RepID=A0ABV1A1D8_9TELE
MLPLSDKKRGTSLVQKPFPSIHLWALLLRLSIKSTKDEQHYVQKNSPCFYPFLQGCTFFLSTLSFPSTLFHPSFSSLQRLSIKLTIGKPFSIQVFRWRSPQGI